MNFRSARLASWQTHLPLRERARQLLIARYQEHLTPQEWTSAQLKINAELYRLHFCPGLLGMPKEILKELEKKPLSYPPGGSPIITYFALKHQAQEVADKLPKFEPMPEEIDATVAEYLASRPVKDK